MSCKQCLLLSILWMHFGASWLVGIDVHALSKEEAKSADLATQLVIASNKILEEAIDKGRDYQEVKLLDRIYQEAKNIKLVLAPNTNPQEPQSKKEGFGAAFKKAFEPPIDLDKALDLVDTLHKELKDAKWGSDFASMLTITEQLENSLHTAMNLKAQWLDTRKAN